MLTIGNFEKEEDSLCEQQGGLRSVATVSVDDCTFRLASVVIVFYFLSLCLVPVSAPRGFFFHLGSPVYLPAQKPTLPTINLTQIARTPLNLV